MLIASETDLPIVMGFLDKTASTPLKSGKSGSVCQLQTQFQLITTIIE